MKNNLPDFINNYKEYVNTLPLSKEILAILSEENTIDKNPLFYLEYASLFKENFKFKEASNKIDKLNIAGFFCYKYSLLMDNTLDSELKQSTLALSNIYLEETIKLLTDLFGLKNNFWEFWNSRKKEFYKASALGKDLFKKNEVLLEEYENLCDFKSAMGKIALDSLFILSGCENKNVYEKLIESHKLFSVGFQINDDIEDFIEDFENKDFNYAYYIFSKNHTEETDNINNLNKMLYINGTAVELYKTSLSYFSRALTIAYKTGENKWHETISGKIAETNSAINAIEEYLTILKTKVSLRENAIKSNSFEYSFNSDSRIEKGLKYLVDEWEINFPEAKHIMVLSDLEGFQNKETIHTTDIFQRGILTNNLIDIARNYNLNMSKIINHEIDYLVENRNKDDVGGWSYFPTVKEIAADADDLGQMIQVFIKGNRKNIIDEYCKPPIRILLEECYQNSTGGIETWIIPKNNRTEIQKKQHEFNSTKWGSGPDIEVMANFLYGLSIDNYLTYKDVIESGVKYIFNNIEDGFFWYSRWYYGWLYGTMLCVRLSLELLKNNSREEEFFTNTLSKIKQNILNNQNDDGGWSIVFNGKSDPLNTSFALYTLMLLENTADKSLSIEKGVEYLNESQNPDGSWNAIQFIKPRLNEPYKSKVITTSYVLNSLTLYNGRYIN